MREERETWSGERSCKVSAMASSSLMQSFLNPSRNWFAALHCKTISKRLRNYGTRVSLSSSSLSPRVSDTNTPIWSLRNRISRATIRRSVRSNGRYRHQGSAFSPPPRDRRRQAPAHQARHGSLHEARVLARRSAGFFFLSRLIVVQMKRQWYLVVLITCFGMAWKMFQIHLRWCRNCSFWLLESDYLGSDLR